MYNLTGRYGRSRLSVTLQPLTDKTSDTGSNMLNAFLMYLECQCGGIQGLKWPQSGAQFPGRAGCPKLCTRCSICGTLFGSWHILHIPPRSQLATSHRLMLEIGHGDQLYKAPTRRKPTDSKSLRPKLRILPTMPTTAAAICTQHGWPSKGT
jgi:hypothetical protein